MRRMAFQKNNPKENNMKQTSEDLKTLTNEVELRNKKKKVWRLVHERAVEVIKIGIQKWDFIFLKVRIFFHLLSYECEVNFCFAF